MVRNYKKKETRSKEIDEDVMKSAIDAVIQNRLSYRKAAEKYNIKPSTLESRVKKIKTKVSDEDSRPRTFNSKFTSLQVFSSEEEALLNEYITTCCKMHYGLTAFQCRKLAYEYAKKLKLKYPENWDKKEMAGIDWLHGFRKRNTNLSLRKPENTSAARSFGFNKTAVTEFYNNLKNILERHTFTADRIYNFDESGVSTVLSTLKVLAPKTLKQVGQIVSGERGELVTFGGIISASGNTIPPLFVFPRVHYKDHFIEGAPEGSIGAANKSGWINADIFVSVLKHIQKHTLCSKNNPILLLCDNHESHISLEAINYARENGIIYLSFPPHTSHRLQPLDVGVFGPFKSKLKTTFNNWHTMNPGKTITIYNIPKLVKITYFESFTSKNITSGFTTPGIWPLNELAFSDDDFAPTVVYTSANSENDPSIQNTSRDNQPSCTSPSILHHHCSPSTFAPEHLQDSVVEAREPPISRPEDMQQLTTEACEPPTSPLQELAAKAREPLNTVHEEQERIDQSTLMHEIVGSCIPVTPESIRPYPSIVRNKKTKSKGRQPGKSRIYTDTPEKNRIEDKQREKEMKRIEKERRERAKTIKRALTDVQKTPQLSMKTKKKKVNKVESCDSESEGSEISLHESSASMIDSEEDECGENLVKTLVDVKPENIKVNCFLLIRFEKKSTVVYYVGQVISHYSSTEFKVSYLRKKPGSWSFVFPNIKDEHTVYITDVAVVLPDPKPPSTTRTSRIFTFSVDISSFNVQ